jgi:hypothetical protein
MKGPITNNKLLDCLGITISLTNNLSASANGCMIPQIPTALGPHRRCIEAITFLSAIVTKATAINIGTNTINTSTMLYKTIIYFPISLKLVLLYNYSTN